MVNIIFHQDFYRVYDSDPAAEAGRIEPIIKEITRHDTYKLVKPVPAKEVDILRAHSSEHYKSEQVWQNRCKMAMLAAGAAMKAAELAADGNPSFACIRPPGHHASRDSSWGYCTFNNMAVALLALKDWGMIRSALILDFDHHFGDGTVNILGKRPEFTIINPDVKQGHDNYLKYVKQRLTAAGRHDITAASAGFDSYHKDPMGGPLTTDDYHAIGAMLKEYAERQTASKRFALLEGGYYKEDLGLNVHAFCTGFN